MSSFVEFQRASATASKDAKSSEKSIIHLKKQLQFLYGYVLGFLMALTTLLCYDRFLMQAAQLRHHSAKTTPAHTDYTGFSPQSKSIADSLQQRLFDEVRILCMVLTTPAQHETRAAHVKATWGKRCTRLVFLSSEPDDELGAVSVVDSASDTYDLLWHKIRQGFSYIYAQYYAQYDWFLKADDDTYVIMENLRYSLYAYQPETPVFFGYELVQQNVTYMSGGAGYVLSKEALRRAVTLGFKNGTLCPPANYALPEDYSMSICLQNVGALPLDGRFVLPNEKKQKMFPLRLYDFMNVNETLTNADWLARLTPYTVEWGLDCCSNYSISFHYTHPTEMYIFDFLIYHLRTIGLSQPIAGLPKKIDFTAFSSRFSNNKMESASKMPLKWVDVY
ncbi:glycoprotein-N-acetylgalactosamine 3-beta-galactosyltransferase 1-like [Anastrepha obliqua]|uniref:glycoprotein-N-acetylgalactosamine 3-beta-galactosyltransferase 1-like n=1 Tax=Anastrepha obliqua TaxID=95512 RepID=UPI00240A2DED|nr:glycoprotein-N-acetylgalactosamine 3-beta-galactosyltransferase 1-like [Anastrepha obliqua]